MYHLPYRIPDIVTVLVSQPSTSTLLRTTYVYLCLRLQPPSAYDIMSDNKERRSEDDESELGSESLPPVPPRGVHLIPDDTTPTIINSTKALLASNGLLSLARTRLLQQHERLSRYQFLQAPTTIPDKPVPSP